MRNKKTSFLYRLLKPIVKFFYLKIHHQGSENLPEEPCIVVGNHSQNNGPLACEFYSARPRYTWCAWNMMHLKEVPAYAFQDFWSQKPKWIQPYFKVMSYVIAPLSVLVFKNANTIPVYRDMRLINTFRTTVNCLEEGMDVVIFPEKDEKYNHFLYQFQDKFIDVARMYYKKTGKEVSFVPLYLAPRLKTMYYGKPTKFHADAPIDEERQRIKEYLMTEITNMAVSLPEHTVVPYRNIPKKLYPSNKPKEAPHEKTGG